MRILVVSAHYPPNFVSGGSLQPQRLARALRSLGDDVSVYAGWLEGGRRPGETWSEADETGLPVRWIGTARAWTDWGDRRNVDNRVVTRDFRRHLREVGPDIVHFHSIQSFGGPLLGVAREAGARVVVTMHDFWWCCARQFLVTRDHRPCSLVVDAGVCPCHAGRPALERRNARLAGHRAQADLVLAPSASAARVLEANGLGPVDVDENGVVAGSAVAGGRARAASDGPVRFLYVGGSDPMKGAEVLVDAVDQLTAASPDGWQLTAYGLDPATSAPGFPVDVRPSFDPSRAAEIYTAADVLVVPSVMRESFSLVTRA